MKVIVTNTYYPPAAIEWLVRWAAEQFEVTNYVDEVKVTDARWARSGRCSGKRVLIRLGPPSCFPTPLHTRFKRVPKIALANWQEALVGTAAHEFQHSRQFRVRIVGRREHGVLLPRLSEVEADHAEVWLLGKYRGGVRASLDEEIKAAEGRYAAKVAIRRERAAAKAAVKHAPETKAAKLRAKIATWLRKLKVAQTYLKKYRRRLRRLEKIGTPATAQGGGP